MSTAETRELQFPSMTLPTAATEGNGRASRASSNVVPFIGNFSIQYNFTSASIAVLVLTDSRYLGYPLAKQPDWSDDATTPAVFLGAMVGMLFMGRSGDVLGRAKALQMTLAIAALGSIIPACAVLRNPNVAYGIIFAGRIVLGVGVGGIYPLSAVSSAEGSTDAKTRGSRVGKAFFGQCFGQVLPYPLAMILLTTMQPPTPAEWVPNVQFRVLFAMGAVPAILVLILSLCEEHTSRPAVTHQRSSIIQDLSRQPSATIRALVGTSLTWFMYDVAFYGMTIFTPTILSGICMLGTKKDGQCSQTLFQTSAEATIVALMGIPGNALAIFLLDRWGSKRLNVVGFAIAACLFIAMALVWSVDDQQHGLLFVLFCALTFALNFGPSLGTYVLPAICFPKEVRSTCHGISATGGKLGALAGTFMFTPLSAHVGVTGILWVQAVISIVAAIVSALLLKHDWEYLLDDDKDAVESFVNGMLVEASAPSNTGVL